MHAVPSRAGRARAPPAPPRLRARDGTGTPPGCVCVCTEARALRCLRLHGRALGHLDVDLLAREVLVHLADLERRERLEEAGAVVREVRLDVDELLEVVELAVHLEHAHLLAVE